MTQQHRTHSPAAAPHLPARRPWVVLVIGIALVALLAGGATGYLIGTPRTPGPDSPEAGFARDMQTHHAQAVDMSLTIRDKTTDPTLDAVAYDIATTQQQQSGQMFAWLQLWELNQAGDRPPMTWMHRAGTGSTDHPGMSGMSGHSDHPTQPGRARMPGMATPAQLRQLKEADGTAAETLYLRLMIRHHRGGITMARAATRLCDQAQVVHLAQAMVSSQQSEITALQDLLPEPNADANT